MKNELTTPKRNIKKSSCFVFISSIYLVLLPSLVFAGPIENGVDWLLDLLTNGIARSLAIIGVVVLGYMAWAGKLTWGRAGQWIGGIVLVFGGAALVDIIIAAVA